MHLAKNRWYAVLASRELAEDRPLGARRLGLDLVFWRGADGGVAVANDRCPHRRMKLSAGRVRGGELECPFHGFRFEAGGACMAIPAHPGRTIPRAMHLDTLPVREAHGLVWIWTGPDVAPEGPVPFFDFEGRSYAGSEMVVPVATHYTLGIENQLDFAHLPFVHRTTIGRFVGEAADVTCDVDGDHIVGHIVGHSAGGDIELIAPNIWRLRTGRAWQFLAFAPVDDDAMVYYVRTYHGVAAKGIGWIVGATQRLTTPVILSQDIRVVAGQPNGEVRLEGMGEVLVPSDAPIIAYRRWRETVRAPFEPFARDAPLVPVQRLER